jgi:hypothetical protein
LKAFCFMLILLKFAINSSPKARGFECHKVNFVVRSNR